MNDLPLVLVAFQWGPVRWERVNVGADWYEEVRGLSWCVCDGVSAWSSEPVTAWVVTHIQKRSRWGIIIQRRPRKWWPFIVHAWFTFRYQTQERDYWIPGTERVLYLRSPGWRFQPADDVWVFSRGYLGLHWD